jgi:hypothetical protein
MLLMKLAARHCSAGNTAGRGEGEDRMRRAGLASD